MVSVDVALIAMSSFSFLLMQSVGILDFWKIQIKDPSKSFEHIVDSELFIQ